MLFYKLFLEKENMHMFKRFYLLLSVLISIGIPFITVTQFVEVPVKLNDLVISNTTNPITIQEESVSYLPIILWSIYVVGVLIFSLKFIFNLSKISLKIKRNPKLKTQKSIHVLLEELIVPHTFLSYIFLNKTHFETQQIPAEVLIHEEAHVIQKHSLDILFIELFQIAFWFNPLIYLLKKSIKLNHEFLADQEVINKGVTLSKYQQILLAFSSNALEPQLATAINYSSIKKRFTVMKTSSSKTGIWLRSIVLLPLLAILIYSFSTKEVIEKEIGTSSEVLIVAQQKASAEQLIEFNKLAKQYNEQPEATRVVPLTNLKKLEHIYKIMSASQKENAQPFPNCSKDHLNQSLTTANSQQQPTATINGVPCEGCTVNLSKEGTEKLILGTNSDEAVTSFKIKFIGKPTVSVEGNKLNKEAIALVYDNEPLKMIQIFSIKTTNSSIKMPILIQLVDKNDENYSNSPIVKKGEPGMIPPPPPPPPASPKSPLDFVIEMTKKGATFYFEDKEITSDQAKNMLKENKYLNISAKDSSSKNPKIYISKEPITINTSKKAKNVVVISDEDGMIPPPPPPPARSAYEYVKSLKNDNISYFYNGKSVSYDEILKITEKEPNINITTNILNQTGTVHFTSIK